MSDLTRGHESARNNWISPFQFEPSNNWLGVELTATTTSSAATPLVGSGLTISIVVDDSFDVSVAFGGSDVVATTAHKRIKAGNDFVFTLRPEDNFTHVAVITKTGEANVQITRGNGG